MVFRGITPDGAPMLRRRNGLSQVKGILYNARSFDGLGGYC
jgi:hypothetical protein